MSRRVQEPVEVLGPLGPCGTQTPGAVIVWRRRRLRVLECLAEWYEAGRWWEGETERRFVRVLTEAGIYELSHDASTGRWQMDRILD
ncbi:MAG TPA: DUF6504 family protein [Limnochordales bacterium]